MLCQAPPGQSLGMTNKSCNESANLFLRYRQFYVNHMLCSSLGWKSESWHREVLKHKSWELMLASLMLQSVWLRLCLHSGFRVFTLRVLVVLPSTASVTLVISKSLFDGLFFTLF